MPKINKRKLQILLVKRSIVFNIPKCSCIFPKPNIGHKNSNVHYIEIKSTKNSVIKNYLITKFQLTEAKIK